VKAVSNRLQRLAWGVGPLPGRQCGADVMERVQRHNASLCVPRLLDCSAREL